MAAFGKLIRTTAFRLTLVYLLLFALFAASLLAFFAWNTRRLITEQITMQTKDGEARMRFADSWVLRDGKIAIHFAGMVQHADGSLA